MVVVVAGWWWWDGSWAGLTPKRRHCNLTNAAMNKFAEVAFFSLSLEYVLQSGITGSQSRNSSWLILRQCELGHAEDRRGNKGVGKYWSGNSEQTLPYLHDMPFKSLPVFTLRKHSLYIPLFFFGFFLLVVVLFCLFCLFSSIYWTEEMRRQCNPVLM